MHVTLASLTVPNPVFLDAVARNLVRRQFVALLDGTNDFTEVVVLLHKGDGIQNLPDAVCGQGEGEFVVCAQRSRTVGHQGSLHQKGFTDDVKEVLTVLDGVQGEVERVVELLTEVNLLPDATLVHHIGLPKVGVGDDALGYIGFLDVGTVQHIRRLSQA